MNPKQIILSLSTVFILCSCATTQKIVYLQDQVIGQEQPVELGKYITIKPQDQLSIVVSSKDPQLATIFNLPRVQSTVGASNIDNQNGEILGYSVDSKGNIDFPVIGEINIEGLTREEIAVLIKSKLTGSSLIKDPVVTVNFLNLQFSVLGEVTKPGKYNIDKDRITIIEALSAAGDLTIFGKRDKVFLTRTGDKRITYELDLRSANIYSSPAFYVQQNDVIYVEPNGVRANQSTVNGNSARSISLWMSIASFLTTIGVLFFK